VRILKSTFESRAAIVAEVRKMKCGEILVVEVTTPEFLPAMKKAIAVITDHGGLMTHAAIIAREFKIPCIVGTKIATQVLKNGDLVEVDANKGIVRKLTT
jgi:pyruvate,water dikinase